MHRQFELLAESGEKVGEPSKALAAQLAAMQSHKEDTSCGFVEEGQSEDELTPAEAAEQGVEMPERSGSGKNSSVNNKV